MAFDLSIYKSTWQKLNRSKIVATPQNNLELTPVKVFDVLDSTNTKLWELIDRQLEIPWALIALQQTAGRGQWGHSWVSQKGGLYLSVALDLDLELNCYPHLVMATAWGIAKILKIYQLPITIKWSNDLILEHRKLGGIKIETRNFKNKLTKGVIGVGINWRNSVPEMGINLADYSQNQPKILINSLEELSAIASYGIAFGYQYYLSVGIEQLLTEYSTILHSMGKQVIINGCTGEVVGVTIDGKLKVKMRSPGASTILTFAPGQISLGY